MAKPPYLIPYLCFLGEHDSGQQGQAFLSLELLTGDNSADVTHGVPKGYGTLCLHQFIFLSQENKSCSACLQMCLKKFQSLTSIKIIVIVLSKRYAYFYYFIQKITQNTKSLPECL